MKSVLIVANVGKEHILKFHVPTIKLLKNNGWQVDVACAGEDQIPYCDNRFIMKWKRNPFSLSFFKGERQLKKILKTRHYDVVYCHTPVGGLAGRLSAKKYKKTGTKIIYFCHGFHFYKGCSAFNKIFYFFEKKMSKYTDLFFSINDEDTYVIRNKFKKTCVQLPGVGVDFSKIDINNKKQIRALYRKEYGISNECVLIYVAELIKNKNQIFLLKALRELVKNDSGYRLFLVGPDHINNKYQRIAAKLNLKEYVVFTGWRDDALNLICMSDICVASSIREGFGINLVESAYLGLPIVASNNRGHRCVINNLGGHLVNNPKEMAYAVSSIKKSGTSINYSAELLEQYKSENVSKKIVKILEEILL